MNDELIALGWDDAVARLFEEHAAPETIPARIAAQHRGGLVAVTPDGSVLATTTARMRRDAPARLHPVVGDWVALRPFRAGEHALVDRLMPRRSEIVRKAAGETGEEQAVAANVDVALLAAALNVERNEARLERYLALAWESGAQPVVVLTKADLHEDPKEAAAAIERIAFGVPVLVTSSASGEGIEDVAALLRPNRTAVLLGPSGTGKSSLVNRLCGREVQDVGAIRDSDARGRHTTTARELVVVPGGGVLVDTPGLRELHLVDDAGIERSFEDILELAAGCRFRDCRHDKEPGCAVRAAVEDGALDAKRLERYRKIEREMAALERRNDRRLMAEQTRRWKAVTKAHRKNPTKKR